MNYPSFEEILQFVYTSVGRARGKKLRVNTIVKKVFEQFGRKETKATHNFWDCGKVVRDKFVWHIPKYKYSDGDLKLIHLSIYCLEILGFFHHENISLILNKSVDVKNITYLELSKIPEYKVFLQMQLGEILSDIGHRFHVTRYADDKKFIFTVENIRKGIEIHTSLLNKAMYDGKDEFLTQFAQDILRLFDCSYKNITSDDSDIIKANQLLQEKIKNLEQEKAQLEHQNNLQKMEISALMVENNNFKQSLEDTTVQSTSLINKPQQSLFDDIEENLLKHLKQMNPTAFEKFSLEFIKQLAKVKGGHVEIVHNGQVGDGGVDGIIKVKKLVGRGTEDIFVQCKRYGDNSIGDPEIKGFVGAIVQHGKRNGIFITTSKFSKSAKKSIEGFEKNGYIIDMFDGQSIVQLMLENKIGIIEEISTHKLIDFDYFQQFA